MLPSWTLTFITAMEQRRASGPPRPSCSNTPSKRPSARAANCFLASAPGSISTTATTYSSQGAAWHLDMMWLRWLSHGNKPIADSRLGRSYASVQGYGQKVAGMDLGWVYPGSGGTCDSRPPMKPAFANGGDQADAVTFASPDPSASDAGPSTDAPGQQASGVADRELTVGIEEDPDAEFRAAEGPVPPATGPRVINVGIHGPGAQVALWRRAWRDKVAAFSSGL